MAGPWEQYAPAAPAQSAGDGPWSQYAPAAADTASDHQGDQSLTGGLTTLASNLGGAAAGLIEAPLSGVTSAAADLVNTGSKAVGLGDPGLTGYEPRSESGKAFAKLPGDLMSAIHAPEAIDLGLRKIANLPETVLGGSINDIQDPATRAAAQQVLPFWMRMTPDERLTYLRSGMKVGSDLATLTPAAALATAPLRAGARSIVRAATGTFDDEAAAQAAKVYQPAPSAPPIKPHAGFTPEELYTAPAEPGSAQLPRTDVSGKTAPTKYTAADGTHTVTSANGATTATEAANGAIKVTGSNTAPTAQGAGEGTARLARMADEVHGQGKVMTSDATVSAPESAAYDKLSQMGYVVERNPKATTNPATGGLVSDDPRNPVFTVKPQPEGVPNKATEPVEFTPPGKDVPKTVPDKAAEKLQGAAAQLVDEAGGRGGSTPDDVVARGQAHANAIDKGEQYLENWTNQAYETAKQRSAGTTVPLEGTQKLFATEKSAFMQNQESLHTRNAVLQHAEELGLYDPKTAKLTPGSVEQIENLRKFVNDQYQPRTAGIVSRLKSELDQDVFTHAGEDIYEQGRALRTARATLFENPEGVEALRAAPGNKMGAERPTPVENIPRAVQGMSDEGFRGYMSTLRRIGRASPELSKASADALNATRTHFAQGFSDAAAGKGGWNAKAANKFLVDNSRKMREVFSPEELQRYKSVNDAGNVIHKPGALAQLAKPLHWVATLGGVMGHGIVGGAVTHVLGSGLETMAKASTGRKAVKAVNSKLSPALQAGGGKNP